MFSAKNPIHRLREIEDRLREVTLYLEPKYKALEVMYEKKAHRYYGMIEDMPEWIEKENLIKERERIHICLALAWERSPDTMW